MKTRIVNKLYGTKGTVDVLENNTAVVHVEGQPDKIIPLNKLTEAIEELSIYTTSNGHIHLGVWDNEKN